MIEAARSFRCCEEVTRNDVSVQRKVSERGRENSWMFNFNIFQHLSAGQIRTYANSANRPDWHLYSFLLPSLTSLNVNINSSGASAKRLTHHFPKAKPLAHNPQVIMRRKKCDGKQLRSHCASGGTRASCSLDQLRQGYLTPSPPHRWTHHMEGEGLHQSNATPRGTQALSPLGESLEREPKCGGIWTNEALVLKHIWSVGINKKKRIFRLPAGISGCTSFPSTCLNNCTHREGEKH